MANDIRHRVFEVLHVASPGDRAARAVNFTIMGLIVLSVASVIFETVESLAAGYATFFRMIEICTVAVFTVEYILRLWSATLDERYSGAVSGRLKFAVTPMALVDLAAIAPFYLPRVVHLDFRFLRAVRLFRLFRLFKLGRYSQSLQTFGRVMSRKKDEMLVTLFIMTLVIILASSLMYFVEYDPPNGTFSSIPAAMWWAVSTLTTVGYGDIYPLTPLGKFLGSVVAVMGIGLFALPTGILGAAFVEELQKQHAKKRVCPHCGKEID